MNTASSVVAPRTVMPSRALLAEGLGSAGQAGLQEQPVAEGYWAQDHWCISDPIFEPFEQPSRQSLSDTRSTIDFTCLPLGIREEVKAFLAWQLQTYRFRLTTVFTYGADLHFIAEFLSERFPDPRSLTASPGERLLQEFEAFIADRRGAAFSARAGRRAAHDYRKTLALFRGLMRFVSHWTDQRPEIEKDRWDLRTFPGARIPLSSSQYWLSFAEIPLVFRSLAKRYVQVRINRGLSRSPCYNDVRTLTLFLTFIHARHPTWRDLTPLTRVDIEAYLAWCRQHYPPEKTTYQSYLRSLGNFLAYIQRAGYAEAPTTPAVLLLLREDLRRRRRRPDDTIRYIPEAVLAQLESNLHQLRPAEYIPAVILLRASGWRISDVLGLRYDSCLERTGLGWYLQGDIVKTQILNHRIPITDEVAAVVQSVVEQTRERSTSENNPERFLFVRYDGRRRGNPPLGEAIAGALNRLAAKYQIATDQGEIFHFGNHAFRHTKAVELINNGMSLLHVQKWLAHCSPEMTLRYARILDETLRQAWLEATKGGLFRLDGVGGLSRVTLGDVADEDLVEWAYIRTHLDAVRMPHGYCFKPLKQPCPAQEQPCLSCRNLCTTTEFLPEFERQMEGTKAVIAEGQARGRVVWVQKNETLLGRLEGIAQVLREQKTHHTAGKRGREYVGQERGAMSNETAG